MNKIICQKNYLKQNISKIIWNQIENTVYKVDIYSMLLDISMHSPIAYLTISTQLLLSFTGSAVMDVILSCEN